MRRIAAYEKTQLARKIASRVPSIISRILAPNIRISHRPMPHSPSNSARSSLRAERENYLDPWP